MINFNKKELEFNFDLLRTERDELSFKTTMLLFQSVLLMEM